MATGTSRCTVDIAPLDDVRNTLANIVMAGDIGATAVCSVIPCSRNRLGQIITGAAVYFVATGTSPGGRDEVKRLGNKLRLGFVSRHGKGNFDCAVHMHRRVGDQQHIVACRIFQTGSGSIMTAYTLGIMVICCRCHCRSMADVTAHCCRCCGVTVAAGDARSGSKETVGVGAGSVQSGINVIRVDADGVSANADSTEPGGVVMGRRTDFAVVRRVAVAHGALVAAKSTIPGW